MNLKPLNTQILVKLCENRAESQIGDIYIPDSAKNQNITVYAIVQALGSGINSHGQFISFNVKIGDKILMPRYTQVPAIKQGKDIYVITNEEEILGIADE